MKHLSLIILTICALTIKVYSASSDSSVRKHELGISVFSAHFSNNTYHNYLYNSKLFARSFQAIQYRKQLNDKLKFRVLLDLQRYRLNRGNLPSYYGNYDFYYGGSTIIQDPIYRETSVRLSLGIQRTFSENRKGSKYVFFDILEKYGTYSQVGLIERYNYNYQEPNNVIDLKARGNLQEIGGSLGFGVEKNISDQWSFNFELSFDATYTRRENTITNQIDYLSNALMQPINRFVFSYKL